MLMLKRKEFHGVGVVLSAANIVTMICLVKQHICSNQQAATNSNDEVIQVLTWLIEGLIQYQSQEVEQVIAHMTRIQTS